jgi:diadenylate cyclase
MELFKTLWSNYLVNIIDVLAVAYIFYRMIIMVKGTRAVQIIVGMLLLLLLTFVAQVLGFRTLTWLFEKFWYAAVFVVVVVFQPEIRSALAQLGSHRWGKILVPSELGFVNEVIEAVKEFSDKHIGALVVFEQDTGLRNYIETGTIINAHVSRELINSIFNTKSPLHDGAVIIQNARLIAAGCVLPLSHEPDISKILGTRHRAAVGLSEISDAIVIVISEESGNVSVAKEGRLETGVDIEELRVTLLDNFRARAEAGLTKRFGGK